MPTMKRLSTWLCLYTTLSAIFAWDCYQMSEYCSEGNKLLPGQFCYDGRAYNLCGGDPYDPPTKLCQNYCGGFIAGCIL
jgi:hypothetical protein